MADLILTTFDWVPEPPRGFVRDLRVRWALEEAGLPYRVASVPFRDRGDQPGFKRSSQHLGRGGCDGCSEAAFGSVRARRVALAGSALGCAA